MQCEEWADANSELFKEAHDEAVHKNSYKRKLYELISASLNTSRQEGFKGFRGEARPLGAKRGAAWRLNPLAFGNTIFSIAP